MLKHFHKENALSAAFAHFIHLHIVQFSRCALISSETKSENPIPFGCSDSFSALSYYRYPVAFIAPNKVLFAYFFFQEKVGGE